MLLQFKMFALQRFGKFSRSWSMVGIMSFVDSSRVVQHGEKSNYLRIGTGLRTKPLAVFKNPSPMIDAVISIDRQYVLLQNRC